MTIYAYTADEREEAEQVEREEKEMSLSCTRCGGSGFLNDHGAPENAPQMEIEELREWCEDHPDEDFQVCDCCGDGEEWYGVPGEHYNNDDPPGHGGPYAYNGGYCECH